MTFLDTLRSVGGLTHYYPLEKDARDLVGSAHGDNRGVVFRGDRANFDGRSYIELPDHPDFSVSTTGGMTIVVFLAITNWRGGGGQSQYVHWAGKGVGGAHEWTFRHYVEGGSGEAGSRPGRISFYHFNPKGGLGAGSYVQEGRPTDEHVYVATCDMRKVQMYKDGTRKDADLLSGYNITPRNTTTPARLGTRDRSTGYLVGTMRGVAFFNRVLSSEEITRLYDARNEDLSDGEGGGTEPEPEPNEFVTIGGAAYPFTGTDVKRDTDQLVLYTGNESPANEWGTEVVVRDGVIEDVVTRQPGISIPEGAVLLSGHGEARLWLDEHAVAGAEVRIPGVEVKPPEDLLLIGDDPDLGEIAEKHNRLVQQLREQDALTSGQKPN